MASKNKPNKLAFLSMPAPASYVAGLGRGASGFTTRSDIGPAREGPSAEVIAEAQAKRGEEPEIDPDQFQDPDNEVGLFAGTTYEQDDEEADKIYEAVDDAMDSRRRARREAQESLLLAQHRAERPKIQQQFADLKRQLSSITSTEWENIPEVGNLTKRSAKKRRLAEERSYAVPDSVLVGDRERGAVVSGLDDVQMKGTGYDTPATTGLLTNFVEIGQARDKILSLKLDQLGTSTSLDPSQGPSSLAASASANPSYLSGHTTSIDPKGYLTSLSSLSSTLKSTSEISDIKRARTLFDSLVKSNPKHAPGWIAAACLEEHAGRMGKARKIIREGCEMCKGNEDVWIECARLHNTEDAKIILANAVQHVGQSVRIWLTAADLETDVKAKKRVLRKALEHIPNSVRLWKETVNLESSASDARILLSRAVEVIPQSVELWLALARLETPEKARQVLNKARKAVPTSHEIWIAAGRLVEQQAVVAAGLGGPMSDVMKKEENGGASTSEVVKSEPTETQLSTKAKLTPSQQAELDKSYDQIDKLISGAVRDLRRHQVLLTREQWFKEAEKCEAEGSPRTAEAIIKATINMDMDGGEEQSGGAIGEMEDEDKLDTWMTDAQSMEEKGRVACARAVLGVALRVFPNKSGLWRRAAELEKSHGTRESLHAVLDRAVQHCPQAEVLWLMAAKEKWLAADVPGARGVLERAFVANPESEQIWLAAVKLEAENGEFAVARELLVRARTVADTERIWMKSAVFERQRQQTSTALSTLTTALRKFPTFPKLYMIQGQIHQYDASPPSILAARAAYAAGIKACPKEPMLWILASRLEERDGRSIKARALLEKARLVNPANEVLWAESVGVEERSATASSNGADGKPDDKSFTPGALANITATTPQAKATLSRALQECPSSGLLWSLALMSEPRASRKTKSVDALKKTKDSPVVVCTVARVLWADRMIERAREWFGRAVKADGDLGDVWGWWLKFERMHGNEEQREIVRSKCIAAEPHHSPVWQAIAKDVKNVGKTTGEILELVADAL